jgi:hypothetical protein
MKKTILLSLLLMLTLRGFSYITIIANSSDRGTTGFARVTENFMTDGPGNCIFELICSDPGRMLCEFLELDPDNTTGCLEIIVTSGGTGNALNDVLTLVNTQGATTGTLVPSNMSVTSNGLTEPAVVTYTKTVSMAENTSTIKVYGYTEAHNLGII